MKTNRVIAIGAAALVAAMAGAGYLLHEQSLHAAAVAAERAAVQRDHRYAQDVAAALRFAKEDQWTQARKALAAAALIHQSQKVRTIQSLLRQLDGSELGVGVPSSSSGLGIAVVSVVAHSPAARAGIVAGDVLQSGALQKSKIGSYNATLRTSLHLRGLIESARPGQPVFLQIKTVTGRISTIVVRVEPAPAGLPWIVGTYTQSSFGDSVTLPTLRDHGIPFGWQLALPGPADGSGRVFFDPVDPMVSVSVYGYNNALNWTLSSQLPPTAVVMNAKENIMGSPGVMYKDTTQVHGQSIVQESLLMGGSSYSSFDDVTVSVPAVEIDTWQPIINNIINSFIPGDVSLSG